jgi:hypothetical protein
LIKRKERLTKERLSSLIIREDLTNKEKKLFEEILFYREVVLTFDFSYYKKVRPKIVLL